MIGFGGGQIINPMTVEALDPEWIKTLEGTRFMASLAITELMGSGEREPALAVNLADVFNDPGFWGMASGTIRTQCVFMQIYVTIYALAIGC
jgi:hypothetical protein